MPKQDFAGAYSSENVAKKLIELTNSGNEPTTYEALEKAIGGDPQDLRHKKLSGALWKIQQLCADADLPSLPALASRAIGVLPGSGFFKAYEDAYGIKAITDAGKARIVASERAAALLVPASCWDEIRRTPRKPKEATTADAKEQEPPC